MEVLAQASEQRWFALQELLVSMQSVEQENITPIGTLRQIDELEDFDCPICLNNITDNDKKIVSSCNHKFCMDCVTKFLPIANLTGVTNCVACPMCRERLQIFKPVEVPLRKVPLYKIRQRLEQQNRVIALYNFQIQQSPHEIQYFVHTIISTWRREDNARRELGHALQLQAELQEQINLRSRPRRTTTNEV
jgi:hypothetical protein